MQYNAFTSLQVAVIAWRLRLKGLQGTSVWSAHVGRWRAAAAKMAVIVPKDDSRFQDAKFRLRRAQWIVTGTSACRCSMARNRLPLRGGQRTVAGTTSSVLCAANTRRIFVSGGYEMLR